jgi:transcriptional regulator with XRE-family HTH domain
VSDITRDYSFGGWLREYRKEKRLTLREISRQLDMDPGNYCKIEKSEQIPASKERVIEILKPLNLEQGRIDFMISLAFQNELAKLRERWK